MGSFPRTGSGRFQKESCSPGAESARADCLHETLRHLAGDLNQHCTHPRRKLGGTLAGEFHGVLLWLLLNTVLHTGNQRTG